MPRKTKGPRLHWRNRKDAPSVWEIRDGTTRLSTGTDDRAEAEKQFAAYLDRKQRPSGPVGPSDLTVSMALSIYGEEHAAHAAAPERIGYAIEALDAFWGDLPVSDVKGATCRRYVKNRINKRTGEPVSSGTTRYELSILQSAINHCYNEGYLTQAPKVLRPSPPPPRQRWLTRQEAAWLLRGARALKKNGRHLADFVLCGLYTGSRKDTILNLRIDTPSTHGGHVDTVNGILYRKPGAKVETSKRQRPARLPRKYLAHLRRQAANGRRFVVEQSIDGEPAMSGSIYHIWSRAIVLAEQMAASRGIDIDLSDVTPHTLKHTAVTWAMQRGADPWDAAGFFSTSLTIIEKVYGHHHPDHQKSAIDALDRRG